MEEPSLGATSKTVLILVEDISLESVDDKIVALGHTFQKRTPFSKPFQWREFEKNLKELRTSGNLLAILFFLSKEAFFNSCSSEGLSVWHNILVEMKSAPSLVFIQEDNFRRVFYDDDLNIQIQETRNLLLDFIGALNLIRDSTQVDYFGSNVDDNDVKRKTLVIDDLIEKILQIIFTINRILTDLKEIDLMVLDKYANHIYN